MRLPVAFTGTAIAAALLLGVLTAPADAGEPLEVDAGALELRVGEDPFALEFVDRASGETLRTLGGGLPAPDDSDARYGPLGFSFDLRVPVIGNAYPRLLRRRRGGDRLVSRRERRLQLGRGRRAGTRPRDQRPARPRPRGPITPRADGVITVDSRVAAGLRARAGTGGPGERLRGGFEAQDAERFLGFGERSNAADQTGNEVFNWAEEGPFSSGEAEDLFRPLLPDFTFPTGPTATNFPIPWAITTPRLRLPDRPDPALALPPRERAARRLAGGDRDRVASGSPSSPGPKPADALRRYSDYAGRQPDPAPWIFGPWFQPTLEAEPFELAGPLPRRGRAGDRRADLHPLPAVRRARRQRAGRERAGRRLPPARLQDHDLLQPAHLHHLRARSTTRRRRTASWSRTRRGSRTCSRTRSPPTSRSRRSTSPVPAARRSSPGCSTRRSTTATTAGWRTSASTRPTDSVFADGRGGSRCTTSTRCCTTAPPTSTPASGWGATRRSSSAPASTASQPHARVVWGGDPTEDWSCSDGLCAAVHQALSIGMSGIAYWGSDIGGFHAVVNPRTDDELNIRWLQLGAVSGVMRTQANGFSFRDNRAERSQVWHPAVLPIWRRYAKLRTQLEPYLRAASRTYQRTGLPIARHLALAYPGDAGGGRGAARVHVRAGPARRAGDRARRGRALALPAPRPLGRPLAIGLLPVEARRAAPPAGSPAQGRPGGHVPAPLEELPLLARAGTSCRCCRAASTRWRPREMGRG